MTEAKAKLEGVTIKPTAGKWIALVFGVACTLGCLSLGLWITSLLGLLLCIGLLHPWCKGWRIAGVVLAAFLVCTVAGLLEQQTNIDRLSRQIAKQGPQSLTQYDGIQIVSLNVLMAGGGWIVGYPEAAQETFLMLFDGPAKRVFHSDFATSSPKVRDAVTALKARGGGSQIVHWPHYDLPGEPRRVSLALNATKVTATKQGQAWQLEAAVAVRYPEAESQRVDFYVLTIAENLFWAAEQRGWLHSYTAIWRWEEQVGTS